MGVEELEIGLISRKCPHCRGLIVGIDWKGEITEQHIDPEDLGIV